MPFSLKESVRSSSEMLLVTATSSERLSLNFSVRPAMFAVGGNVRGRCEGEDQVISGFVTVLSLIYCILYDKSAMQ